MCVCAPSGKKIQVSKNGLYGKIKTYGSFKSGLLYSEGIAYGIMSAGTMPPPRQARTREPYGRARKYHKLGRTLWYHVSECLNGKSIDFIFHAI